MPSPADSLENKFLDAERKVEQQSAALRKELSLSDLVLTQVLFITGLGWLGVAAKLGSSHLFFWIPAALFFYIPSAIVVIHLGREMPLEGGLYQWAKLRFNARIGFLVAWNTWLYSILLLSEMGVITANNLSYAAGSSGAWIAENKWVILGASFVVAAGLTPAVIRGLALGKWIHNIGSVTLVLIFAAMLAFAVPRWIHGTFVIAPVALSFPAVSLLNINLLGKMGFGAFSGAECIALFAGEFRQPQVARTIRKSVWLAAPLVTAIFTMGTACILTFVRPEQLDLVSPVAQNLSLAARSLGFAGPVVPLAMALMLTSRFGVASILFNATTRLPMVAGWDRLLPAWFTQLHPVYRTPVGSILTVGAMSLLFAVFASAGTGSQEAYQLLNNGSAIMYALTYLAMFAIPLIAPGEKPPPVIRIAALSGFLMTALYVVLSVIPIIDVPNPLLFSLKVGGLVIAYNLLGIIFFQNADRRRNSPGRLD